MARRNVAAAAPRTGAVRCAVYTRKSTEEGLEQDYNSLDAQFDAGAAYIASQRHEGWTMVRDRYDDGGFSGGNLDRPALQRLLADVAAGRVQVIVLYKVDRLTRDDDAQDSTAGMVGGPVGHARGVGRLRAGL